MVQKQKKIMELRFRAWEHNTKRMIENVAVRNGLIHNHKNVFYRQGHDTNYKITQSLGFPDKKGNELFIGDIMKIQIHPDDDVSIFKITKLKFGLGVFYKGWNEKDPGSHYAKLDQFNIKHGVKIGNIFANPELMKDEEIEGEKLVALITNDGSNFREWIERNKKDGEKYILVNKIDHCQGIRFDSIEYGYRCHEVDDAVIELAKSRLVENKPKTRSEKNPS